MALYINTDKLESAGENLVNSYGYYNSAISNISSGKSGLDSEVLSSVSSTLSSASTNLNSLLAQTKSLSEAILNASSSYKKAETTSLPAASVAAGAIAGAATGAATATNVAAKQEKKQNIFQKGWSLLTGAVSNVGKAVSSVGSWIGSGLKKVGGWIADAGKAVWNFGKKVVASVGNFVVSLVRGIANFAEAIVDCVAMLGTASLSLLTGMWDLGVWVGNKIAGTNYDLYATGKMWNGVMNFVGAKWVDKGFDYAYANWEPFKWMDENAAKWFKSDGIACKIGNGIGYVTGIIALTLATAGIGTAASGAASTAGAATTAATTAATSTAGAMTIGSTTVTAGQLATTAAFAGFGKGAQDKRAEGGSVLESLGAGTLSAAWDGVSFYLGGKMQGQWGSQIAGKLLPETASPIAQQLTTSAVRIAFDTSLGAADAFTRTGIDTIGADGYYNQDGIWTEFAPGTSYADRYKAVFEQNGGWAGVGQTMATAGVMSTITEGIDMVGFLRNNKPKVDVDSATPTPTNRIVQAATDKIDKIKTAINDKLDASLVKRVTEDNNKIFTEAFDSTSTTAKLKALLGDTGVAKVAKRTIGTVTEKATALKNSISDKISNSDLGQTWKAFSEDVANGTMTKGQAVKEYIKDRLASSRVAKIATSTKSFFGDKITSLKGKVNDLLDSKLVKRVTEDNNKLFTEAIDSGSIKTKLKALLGDTGVAKVAKRTIGTVTEKATALKNSISDKISNSDLGQTWKAFSEDVANGTMTKGQAVKEYIKDRLASSRVAKIATSTKSFFGDKITSLKGKVNDLLDSKLVKRVTEDNNKLFTEAIDSGSIKTKLKALLGDTGVAKVAKRTIGTVTEKATALKNSISDRISNSDLGQAWKQLGDEAAMAGVSRGRVLSQHIVETLSGTKVGKMVVSKVDNIKLGLNERLDGIIAKRVTDANNDALTKAFDSTSTREKINAIINDFRGKTVKEAAAESTELAIRNEVAENAGENVAKTISNSFSEQLRKEGIEIIGTKVNKDGRLYYIIRRNGMKDMVEAETGRLLSDKNGGVVTAIRDMYNQTKTTSTSPTAINDQINNMAGLLDGPPSKVAGKGSPISWNTAKYVLRNGARIQVTASQ